MSSTPAAEPTSRLSFNLRFNRTYGFISLLVALLSLSVLTPPSAKATSRTVVQAWHWPAAAGEFSVIRPFSPALVAYGPGHRGVDLQLPLGSEVMAPTGGTVIFNGLVARTPTLVLDHGRGLRSTYQPVTSSLHIGQVVKTGLVIGFLSASTSRMGTHCGPVPCLHWGVRNSVGYLDPLSLIRPTMPVLLPLRP
ncbi:MAG TPA: M23 family metallopeptidase [Candidatus Nanopelagicaceae bacterium]|nr:M23 family metallopeptidase [Candidatus Nanopelagicaceae bacterium]